MGVTIHYKGKLNAVELTEPFLEEARDIAESMDWPYTLINRKNEDITPVRGLFIRPHPKSEFLTFSVDDKGCLRNTLMLEHLDNGDSYTWYNHIKTQFAPLEVHVAVIKLLRYLKQKYIGDLEVLDEGMYWQTNDISILHEKIKILNEAMDQLEGILKSIPKEPGDDAESIADKIERIIKKRFNKKN